MTLDTFFKKFDQFADAPDAVAKMRELVLQLAVRGRLVNQNPKDEPATKSIERLVALNGSGRAAKPFVDAKSVKLPFEVPGSWKWVRFGDLVRIRTGKLDANAAVEGGEYPFFTCSKTPSQIATYSFDTSAVILAGNGDFNLKSYRGKFDAYQRTYVIEPIGWELGFCFWLISAQIKRITDNQRGSAIPYLRLGDIADPLVPFPPLPEQKRIVAKVVELMALCDRLEAQQQERDKQARALARASLARFAEAPTPANLNLLFHKSYSIPPADLRKAILAMAVQGKLLPQDPKEESAERLISRLEEDRAGLAKSQGVRPPKDVPVLTDEDHPHNIPKTWKWSRIGHLALVIDYGTSQKSHGDSSKIPVYRMGNIFGGRLIDENLKYVDPTIDDLPKLYLKTDDILFNRTNSYELVGKSGIFTGKNDTTTFASYLIRIRLPSTLLFPTYFSMAMNAPYFRQTQIEPEVVQQCGQANFNGTKLSYTVVPVPPLAEQRRIVAKVDQLMALVDQLETQLAASRATAKNLLEALVAELTTGGAHFLDPAVEAERVRKTSLRTRAVK